MKTYTLTLDQAVGEALANEVRDEIGTEHADELEIVEPDYKWIAYGNQYDAIIAQISQDYKNLTE